MEWSPSARHGAGGRLYLERQGLPQSFRGGLRHHWDALVRTAVLRHARSSKGCRMTAKAPKRVRCAVYTRVSTDHGLEQDFNSLHAQHDAAQAYIRSQAHDGWTLARTRYDDGGFSGGSTDRPVLQQLLAGIRADKIDVVVVFKVDRFTPSLAGFAKLVE